MGHICQPAGWFPAPWGELKKKSFVDDTSYTFGEVVHYDKETHIIYIKLTNNPVAESDEGKSGIIIDYDEKENIVGIEILNASSKVIQPNGMIYEIA